jgi:hypothetical protein
VKDFAKRTAEGFNIYKVAILKVCLGTYLAGLAVWSAGSYAWSAMSWDERINTLLCVSGAMATYLVGFFDRTLSRIDAEQKQARGDTQFITKS